MSVGSDKGVKMPASQVIRQGYLRKLKTMKRKYFVLKTETPENSARLEYYDSEKKWKCQAQPKRIISLKSCFNIQRRLDTKYKHVIALYTKEDCFCVVLDGEEELSLWLNALLTLHHGEEGSDDLPHPRQHVWQVNVQKKGLGASMNILGLYHLCLTDKTVTLVKIRPNNTNPIPYDARATDTMEFSLASIRRCGDSECFFYMELGRSAVTGAGELWMHSEDPNIAKSMHATILHAMSSLSGNKDELGPKGRSRSSSANEASKPLFLLARRQTHSGAKSHGLSPSSVGAIIRERCDSLPSRHCVQEAVGSATATPATLTSFDVGRAFSRSPPIFDRTHSGFDGISTESIISAASVDEVDCTAGSEWSTPHLVSKSIPEEETETVNAPSQNEVSSYMEMSVPPVNYKHMLHSGKVGSANHSRTSSLADEGTTSEDYLTMAPPTSDDGYVEMDKSRKRTTSQGGHVSPVSSTCSVTSGTPSTDMRFSEFHLEKVTSYFAPSEEDDCGRPIRAYSVGSRPEAAVKTNRTGASAIENRVRAFSTGSRNRARPPVGTPPRYLVHPIHSCHHINGFAQTPGYKTTSAPQLPGAAMPPRHTYSSSHGSTEPLDDLMEMDFSNKSDNASKTDNKINNTRSSVVRSSQLSLPLPITGANSYRNNVSATDGYLEMSPGSSNAFGYVEMKPADLSSPGSAPFTVPSHRKKSFTRSPPTVSASTTPEGYVEMSWKKNEKKNENNILTKPITIFANNSKDRDNKRFNTEASPYPTVVSGVAESSDDRMSTSPTASPIASPVTPVNSFLNQRRSSKKQQRRNSKEMHTPTGCQSQMIFPFSLNSPGSPMKPFNQKALAETLNRKCSVDASSGTVKLANDYSHDNDIEVAEIINTDYMDMIPGRLSTVKEINEPTYNRIIIENQKSFKQMLNNATKASKTVNDMTDYVNLDSSICSKTSCRKNSQEESFNESSSGDYAIMNPSAIRNKPTESLVVAPKSQNIMRKTSDGDSNSARVNILSSNPLASKTMMTSAPNVASDDHRRPIIITATGHLQPIVADFKPITHDNREPRSIKSCSPKPVESALNRQLCARRPLSRPNSALGETNVPSILESRPSSVNTVLHYASLDLEFTGERSPRPEPLSANSVSSVPTFTYAQIDFVKSEELRNANAINSNVITSNNVSSADN